MCFLVFLLCLINFTINALPILEVNIDIINLSNKSFIFDYCQTNNLLINDINPILNNNQSFQFVFVNIASGDCTYHYKNDSCVLNFQYFVDPLVYQYYYGIFNCPYYQARIKIIDMYNVVFIVS